MTTMELLVSHPEIKNVVFVIGDRDFYDLFKYLKKRPVNTFIFGFKSNLSSHVFKVFNTKQIVYIDDYWLNYITVSCDKDFPPLTPSKVKPSEARSINFSKRVVDSSNQKLVMEKDTSTASKKRKKKRK